MDPTELPTESESEVPPRRRIRVAAPLTSGEAISVTGKQLGLLIAMITVLTAVFGPVFYVRDMAATVRSLAEQMGRVDSSVTGLARDVAGVQTQLAEMRGREQERTRRVDDHESRLRTIETSR